MAFGKSVFVCIREKGETEIEIQEKKETGNGKKKGTIRGSAKECV